MRAVTRVDQNAQLLIKNLIFLLLKKDSQNCCFPSTPPFLQRPRLSFSVSLKPASMNSSFNLQPTKAISDASSSTGMKETDLSTRLDELERKARAYENLVKQLELLPRRTRHSGLIPVGPRVFLPGELVHTNEILVLLGNNGENALFAERSAYQAAGIARRRLAEVRRQVEQLVGPVPTEECSSSRNETQPLKEKVDAAGGTTARHGIVTGSSSEDAVKTVDISAPAEEQANGKTADSTKSKHRKHKKKVHFDPSLEVKEQERDTAGPSSSSGSTGTTGPPQQRDVRVELIQALQNAHQQANEDGFVNLTEFYAEGSDTVQSVSLPSDFKPDENVSFEDDSVDYLDMTHGVKGKNKDKNNDAESEEFDWERREEYFRELLETEAEMEQEEAQAQAESEKSVKNEDTEFGKGFARGFFGPAPRKISTNEDTDAGDASKAAASSFASKEANEHEREKAESETVSTVTEPTEAIRERVVERRRKGRSARRRVKAEASDVVSLLPFAESALGGDELDEQVEGDGDRPTVSRFKAMREMRRANLSNSLR